MKEVAFQTICFSCGVFRAELEALRERGDIDFPIRYLDSTLHMRPEKLHRLLDSTLAAKREANRKVLLLYGDCHAYMCDQEGLPDVSRTRGHNCAEILLGSDRYRELSGEGAFILLPEWTTRWREIFEKELGLQGEAARDFMREMHTKLVYLDTGVMPVPAEHLQMASDALGLPFEVARVSPDCLLAAIREATERTDAHDA